MDLSRNGPRIPRMPHGVLASYGAVIAMAMVTMAAVWLATHAIVERAAVRELQDKRNELENYAKTLAGHIERAIGTVDRSLLAIKRDVERGMRVWPDAELATEHRAHGDFVSVLTVADARGDVVASSISSKGVNLAGRQHFIALRETREAGLVLGLPVRGQASGVMTMHVARRLNARDGSFKGIVSAGLNLDYFAGFYRGIDLGSGGSIEIIGLDGLPRIGEGARGAPSARVGGYAALVERVRRGETRGTDAGVAGPDGPLIRSHYALEGYPLVVTVAKSEAEALRGIAQYRRHAYAYAGGVTLLILALMASVHFFLRRQRWTQAALSGSEARFRALTELTSDWYWETDAAYRFTLMSAGIAHWRMRVPGDYLGKRRWELAFLSPLDGGWERHQETVQARQPFRDFVVRHTDFDGNVGYASLSGEPVADAHGRHLGYRGVGRDVTAEIRLQQRLKLQHRVSAILANARSSEAAVTEVLRAACETFDWQWGARRLTDDKTLSCAETWCVPELESSAFARMTRETVYRRRPDGIMERALESGEPQWVPADSGGMARRMSIATAVGLRMLITVPVSCGGHAIGALEFSSSRLERTDALLSGTLRVLGEMVGQFLQRQSEMEQRQRAEAVLSESELRYQATFDLAAVGIVHTAFDGTYLRVNRKFCEMLGYRAEELVGRNGSEFSHPDDALIGIGNRERMLKGELDTFSQERRYIRKDGSIIWTNRTVSLARDAAGEPLYFIRVIEDVTARKEAEERYRATFDNAPVGIMHTVLDGYGILRANRKLCEMLGYTQEELLGMTSTVFIHPDYRYKDHAHYAQQLISGEIQSYASERKFVRKDGSLLWVHRTVSLVRGASGEPLYFLRVFEDTSERKRAEEEVERERALLRAIVDAIPEFIHVKDSAGRLLLANKAWLVARGIADGNVAGTTAADYFPPAMVAKMAAQDAAVMRTGEALVNFEQRIDQHNPDGDGMVTQWLSTTKVPLRSPDGTIFGIAGVSRDITGIRLSDRRRSMEHAVTRALAEAPSLAEAMTRVIGIMSEAMEWSYGARWESADHGVTLRRAEFWADHELEFDPADRDLWAAMILDHMQGLVGRAWDERKPSWIADLDSDGSSFQRRASARRLGLKSAMAFPILVADETIGVMEFFGREARRHDETMFQILGSIGRQVGQFIQRKEAEEALQRSEAILAATFDQVGVGMAISEITADGQRWLRVNQKLCDILGRTREELLATSPLDLAPPGERRHAADFNEKLLRDEVATYSREKQYVRKDGQVIWASVSLAAVRGPDGCGSRVVSVVQDITEQMRSQRALIESEEQFNQLAGNIPQVFWITDATHRRVIYVSAACESVLGYTATELKAAPRQLVGAVHPDDRRRVYEARKGAATGRYDEIYRITRPDGTLRWLHDRAFPVRDAEGRPYRIAGIAEDITERRRAEDALRESEERFRQAAEALANERNLLRSVIDAIPDDIYVKDRELRYVLMNARGLEIRGIRGGREIMGRSSAEFFPPAVSAGFDAEDRSVMSGGVPVMNREQDVVHANGKRETQLSSKVPLRDLDGNIVGAIGISRDITQLKERTEEISRLNAELEERVRERTAQLELSNRELESFAFSVSHDLRAPLRTIEGFSRILYNEYAGGIDEEGRDCLRRVQSASQRMARLIDALLSLSRITRSRIRVRPIDLSKLAREIGDELLQDDALRHVKFSVAPNMTARADASLLRSVFDNLLRNAWKFTAQAEVAVIEVGSVLHEGRRAYFVRDNGVGFDMSYAGNLFGAFQRLHTEAEFPGTGIGLATVQRIIRRHGGEVWAEAAPGKGAVFYFTLGEARPAAKEPADGAPARREAAAG